MNEYYTACTLDLRCYPNYSFEIGDIDGDSRMEMVSLNQNGNRLRAVDLEGEVLFERRVINYGNWSTPLICVTDIDGDGREEIVVPSFGRRFEDYWTGAVVAGPQEKAVQWPEDRGGGLFVRAPAGRPQDAATERVAFRRRKM